MQQLPSPLLPGNTPGVLSPVIPINYMVTNPVALLVKKTPYTFENVPTSMPPRQNEIQEVDANNFPKLKGWA